jgi:hypothetical protein
VDTQCQRVVDMLGTQHIGRVVRSSILRGQQLRRILPIPHSAAMTRENRGEGGIRTAAGC